ncbi:MAG: uroporphyrinogen-III synthase, partial [Acidimicrobiales bacterium]
DPTVVLEGSLGFDNITAGFQGSLDLKNSAVQFALLQPVTVSPVSGITLTLTTLIFSGTPSDTPKIPASLTLVAKGTAVVPILGATATHPLTASLTVHGGSLVVAMNGISLSSLGVPLTGLFAYASSTVTTFTAGPTLGKVTLQKGFNGFAVYHPTAGVTSVLQTVGFTLPPADVVTFTASSTVTNFVAAAPGVVPPTVACIGPVTAATARSVGFFVDVVATEHTVDGLVEALVGHLENR